MVLRYGHFLPVSHTPAPIAIYYPPYAEPLLQTDSNLYILKVLFGFRLINDSMWAFIYFS